MDEIDRVERSGGARSRSFFERMIGAATLDTATYEAVEHDTTATVQAGAVVVMAAVAQGIASPVAGVISGSIAALLGWLALAGITYFVGTKLFEGTATWGELLRTLGFAMAPGVLYILGIIPLLGALVSIAVFVWVLVAMVVAIRQALDISTGRAVVTGVLAAIAWAAISWIVPGL